MLVSKIRWYWDRLRAMDREEIQVRFRKKVLEWADSRRPLIVWQGSLATPPRAYPCLRPATEAPVLLREGLAEETREILAGNWRAFGHLPLRVDDPPHWQRDYLVGRDYTTSKPAFKINHRDLPFGGDSKLVWELSRWRELVRLAQADYLLGNRTAGDTCLRWLSDWTEKNPPYRGFNWTSALEAGLRLVQFAWLDALLGAPASKERESQWNELKSRILPAHFNYVWRHRSFGSSANNHLMGELSGLIIALARWPRLAELGGSLEVLQSMWEAEVLAQFAEDGGNREQALNYQHFSWEFCWQVRHALLSAGRPVSPAVEERLILAAEFYVAVQVENSPWDYGDSDNASVTPFFSCDRNQTKEWYRWFRSEPGGEAIQYWQGHSPVPPPTQDPPLHVFKESGYVLLRSPPWICRLDASTLGYLTTAAHGHLDALHLSIWFGGMPLVIDPGTGAYYADRDLRAKLTSWGAHNGPTPTGADFPSRRGPFLWSAHHKPPRILRAEPTDCAAELELPAGSVHRAILIDSSAIRVRDSFQPAGSLADFSVKWHFAPGFTLRRLDSRRFSAANGSLAVTIEIDSKWSRIETDADGSGPMEKACSPAFRAVAEAPFLRLWGKGQKPCYFETTFLASSPS